MVQWLHQGTSMLRNVHSVSCNLYTVSRKGITLSDQFVGPIRTAYIARKRY